MVALDIIAIALSVVFLAGKVWIVFRGGSVELDDVNHGSVPRHSRKTIRKTIVRVRIDASRGDSERHIRAAFELALQRWKATRDARAWGRSLTGARGRGGRDKCRQRRRGAARVRVGARSDGGRGVGAAARGGDPWLT